MSLSDALMGAGAGRTIDLCGKTYSINKITQGQKDEFTSWFLARMESQVMKRASAYRKQAVEVRKKLDEIAAREADPKTPHADYMRIRQDRDDVQREAASLEREAREVVKEFDAEVVAEMYEFDGEACRGILATQAGGLRITLILLKSKHPDITMADVVKFYETSKDQTRDLHDKVQWALGFARSEDDPNVNLPAETSANGNG